MIVVVMGVSGVGKTTIGEALARSLACSFLDADDYHPPANVAKMASGIALEDADRWPWLDALNAELRSAKGRVVLACSALKEAYRERLAAGLHDVRFVYLHAPFEVIHARLAQRKHRYMPASLLASQLATLERPAGAIDVEVADTPDACVQRILRALRG